MSKTEAHRQYRYATRRYMRKVEELRKVRMTDTICYNRSRDFFREMFLHLHACMGMWIGVT